MGFPCQRDGRKQKVRNPREVHGGWISSLHGPEWLEDKVRGREYWSGKWPGKVDGRSYRVLDHMILTIKISLLGYLDGSVG